MSKRCLFILIILYVLIWVLTGCSLNPEFTVEGFITDSRGNGIEGVVVTYLGLDGVTATEQVEGVTSELIEGTVETDADGRYEISGLVGKVEITAFKEGYTFYPSKKTVSWILKSADFKGLRENETTVTSVFEDFCRLFNANDVDALANLFHSSYFEERNTTKEELIQYFVESMDIENSSLELKEYRTFEVYDNYAHSDVLMELTIKTIVTKRQEVLFDITLVNDNDLWYIRDLQESNMDMYRIRKTVNSFVDAFAEEDIAQLTSMLTDDYTDVVANDRNAFINYLEELFPRLVIVDYEKKTELYALNEEIKVTVKANIQIDGQFKQNYVFQLGLKCVQLDKTYRVQMCNIWGGPLINIKIDDDDGLSELIYFELDQKALYRIESNNPEVAYDTRMYLYNILYSKIGDNDDYYKAVNRYAIIQMDLAPGGYYVRIDEYYRRPIQCDILIMRYGIY